MFESWIVQYAEFPDSLVREINRITRTDDRGFFLNICIANRQILHGPRCQQILAPLTYATKKCVFAPGDHKRVNVRSVHLRSMSRGLETWPVSTVLCCPIWDSKYLRQHGSQDEGLALRNSLRWVSWIGGSAPFQPSISISYPRHDQYHFKNGHCINLCNFSYGDMTCRS